MRLSDQVTQVRAPLVPDRYGNLRRDWAAATRTVRPADVQPLSTDEVTVDQQRTITRWRMVLHPDRDVEPTDRIEWDGGTYEVDGDVRRWKRRGAVHHLQAVLMRINQGA